MLFHNYWEKVLGSRVKIKALRVLCRFPGKKFTIRELAKVSGVTHFPLLRALADWQGMNLIRLEKHGTANLLTLNLQSHLYPFLRRLFDFEEASKEQLVKKLKKFLPSVKMLVLFGSVHRREEEMNSDIDLLVVTEDKKRIHQAIFQAGSEFRKEFGNSLSAIIFTERELKKEKNKPYMKELIQDYSLIHGRDLLRGWKSG